MASNRGNPSGSNTNMPSGVNKTRSDNLGHDYIDAKTLNSMNIMTKKYETYIKRIYGTLEGFENAIEKATKTSIDANKKEKEAKEKFNKELNAIAQQYGKSSSQFKRHADITKKQMDNIKNDTAKSLLEIEKDFIKQSFKNETSSKQIKYLDSKYIKSNNLSSVSNSYWSDLEKLKSSALDTYGVGFENTKDYKKALMNLNDTYAKDMKNAWKEDFKANHKVLGGIAEGVKDTFDRNKEVLQGMLGPLNLFIEPLKEFFGGFGKIFKFIGGGVKRIFGKFTKKNPTATDVIKSGAYGVGALFIGNKLDKMFGKNKEETALGKFSKIKDGLSSLLGLGKFKGQGKLLGGAKKFLTMGHGALAGSLGILGGGALMVKDGIQGSKMAGQEGWGKSKISASIGGVLGGMDSGFKGAFKNMGKWALMGFGIGNIICPIVGGLIGGLIGGAVGGILGWIGGAKISKVMDSIGKKLKGAFDKVKNVASNMWEGLKNIGSDAKDSFNNGTFFTEFVPDLLDKIKTKLFEGWNMLKESPLGQFVKKLFENIQLGMEKFFTENPIGRFMDKYIMKPIKTAFATMGSYFSFIKDAFEKEGFTGGMVALATGWHKDKKTGLSKFDIYKQSLIDDSDIESVDDAIIRTNGNIIKTNPRDTLVALKDVPQSLNQVREDTNKNLNFNDLNVNNFNDKLNSIIDVLSKILDKDIQVNLPPQTRGDLDLIMSGAIV